MGMKSGQKMPFSHSGVLPWTASFVAKALNEREGIAEEDKWTTEDVLRVARDNARRIYAVGTTRFRLETAKTRETEPRCRADCRGIDEPAATLAFVRVQLRSPLQIKKSRAQ